MRLITFEVAGSDYRLVTNQFEMTTLNVMILYAYRWQIELFFKFMKRTIKGIDLFNHSQNGVEIQFYVLMSVAILMLKLKQHCQELEKDEKKEAARQEKRAEKIRTPSEWIKDIGKVFYKSWKISKNWLVVVKNSLSQVADCQLLKLLNAT